MKKYVLVLVIAIAMVISFCACGSEAPKNHVGDTVATDRAELTLDRAEFAIALTSSAPANFVDFTYDYFMPKEYDATEDKNNPYVAATGHSLVSFTFTINNIDRGESLDLGGSFNPEFIKITYGGEEYTEEVAYGTELAVNGWEKYGSGNVLILAGSSATYRAYMEIGKEPEDFNEPFDITFILPNSAGETEEFTYTVNSGDIETLETAKTNEFLEGMNEAYGELKLVYKYVYRFSNGFSTDVTDTLKESFEKVDVDAVVAEMTAAGIDEETAKEEVKEIISDTDKIRKLLVEMKKTHSSKNVSKIEKKSIETMSKMSKLAYGDLAYAVKR